MSQPSSSASQPIPSSTSGTVSQGHGAWSSLGAIPNSHSGLQDATNLLGLNLPPNTLKIIAQYQAAGRFPPALLNPLQQPIQGPAKPVSTSRTRPTARSHSQPNLRKSRAPSAYSRGVIPKSVAQPLEAACYLPPPMKARNRRAAKSRAKATAPAVASDPSNPNWSVGAARVASQGDGTPNTASRPAHNCSALAKTISERPGFQYLPINLLEQALSSIMEGKNTTSLVPGGTWSSRLGISNLMAHSESPSPRGTGVPAVDVAGLHPRSGSLSPTMQPEGSPLVEQPRFVPTIGGDDAGDPVAFSVAMPTQFPSWYPTMDAIPEWEMPATGLLSMGAPTSEPEQPPATSFMLEGFDAIIQGGGSDVTTAVNEQNDREEPSPSHEYILDIEHSLAEEAARNETRLALPTREDFEGFLSALPGLPNHPSPSAELGREVFMGEAGAEGFEQVVDEFNEFLSGDWEKYVDFEGPERV